ASMNTLAMLQRTRRMICDDEVAAARLCRAHGFRQFGEVFNLSGEGFGPLAPLRVVGEHAAVVLQERAAAACRDQHGVRFTQGRGFFESLNNAPSIALADRGLAEMIGKRTATARAGQD